MAVSPNVRLLARPQSLTWLVLPVQGVLPTIRNNISPTRRLSCWSRTSNAKRPAVAIRCRAALVCSMSSGRGPTSDKLRGGAPGNKLEYERRRDHLLAYAKVWQRKMAAAETADRARYLRRAEYLQELAKKLEDDPCGTLFRTDVWTPADMWRALGFGQASLAEERKPVPEHRPDSCQPHPRQPDRQDFITKETSEEYHIDPITSRKVYKERRLDTSKPLEVSSTASQDGIDKTERNGGGSYEIPVKTFAATMTDLNKQEIKAIVQDPGKKHQNLDNSKTWLTREGFSRYGTSRPPTSLPASLEAAQPSSKKESMETALDRRLRDAKPPASSASIKPTLGTTAASDSSNEPASDKSISHHISSTTKDENIDALRASDIRASAGRARINPADRSREARWKALEQTFEQRVRESEARYAEELKTLKGCLGRIRHGQKLISSQPVEASVDVSSEAQPQARLDDSSQQSPHSIILSNEPPTQADSDISNPQAPKASLNASNQPLKASSKEFRNQVQSFENEYARQQEAEAHQLAEEKAKQVEERRRQAQQDALTAEIRTQKLAMEAHETPDLPEQDTASSGAMQTSPWQPMIRKTALLEVLEQKAKDRALVCEIRGIYEDRYGRISTKHRQHAADSATSAAGDVCPPPQLGSSDGTASTLALGAGQEGKGTSEPLDQRDSAVIQHPSSTSNEVKLKYHWSKNSRLDDQPLAEKTRGPDHDEHAGKVPSIEDNSTAARSDKHRHGAEALPGITLPLAEAPESAPSHVYKVLALSPASQDVSVATMSSSLPESSIPNRSVSSILVHLDQPTKFFAHMDALGTAGYELVDGSRNLLVYKKVEEMAPEMVSEMQKTITTFLRSTEAGMQPASEDMVLKTASDSGNDAARRALLTSSNSSASAPSSPSANSPSPLLDSTLFPPAISAATLSSNSNSNSSSSNNTTSPTPPIPTAHQPRTIHREEPTFTGAHASPAQRRFDRFQRIHRQTYRAMRKEMRRRDDHERRRRRSWRRGAAGVVLLAGAFYGLGWYAEARELAGMRIDEDEGR